MYFIGLKCEKKMGTCSAGNPGAWKQDKTETEGQRNGQRTVPKEDINGLLPRY